MEDPGVKQVQVFSLVGAFRSLVDVGSAVETRVVQQWALCTLLAM
jgi:hypothetical protein